MIKQPKLLQDRSKEFALKAKQMLGNNADINKLLQCACNLCKGSENPAAIRKHLEELLRKDHETD